jgi:hypothetical protein
VYFASQNSASHLHLHLQPILDAALNSGRTSLTLSVERKQLARPLAAASASLNAAQKPESVCTESVDSGTEATLEEEDEEDEEPGFMATVIPTVTLKLAVETPGRAVSVPPQVEEAIRSYALWLGIPSVDLDDPSVLSLAEEGLNAALPDGWTEAFPPLEDFDGAAAVDAGALGSDGREKIFYYNMDTGVSQWEHPNDATYFQRYERILQERGRQRSI